MAAKPGERRLQILQTLAAMLETPRGERVTTAALAAKLDVSEAALYRHFASKAQMFEGLIEFIETTLFTLINKIGSETSDGAAQAQQIVAVVLGFAEQQSGHDAGADRRRARQRGCPAAGADEPALRPHRGGAAAVAADRAGGRQLAGRPGRGSRRADRLRPGPPGTLYAKSGFKRSPQEGWELQRKFLFG